MLHPGMRHLIGRREVLSGSAGLLATPAIVRAQSANNGVALVIGNSTYKWEATLPNVKRDSADVAECFRALGLQTELAHDLDLKSMNDIIEKMKAAARGKNFAAFYFAGHGVSSGGRTRLVPVDADLANPNALDKLVLVFGHRDERPVTAGTLLAYDACRNNPADGWRQLSEEQGGAVLPGKSRATAAATPNVLQIFSTSPGRVALDGPAGQNSPFAAAFMRQLGAPSIDVSELPGRLRRDLLLATKGRQFLWDFNLYTGPFRLNGPKSPPGAARHAVDAAGIIELPNAYAFAKSNGIPLPPGLIAVRPANDPRGARMTGAFKFDSGSGLGRYPEMLLVLSVDPHGSANVVLAGNPPNSRYWRVMYGKAAGDRLEFVPHSTSARYTLDWRDDNSGSVGLFWERSSNVRPISSRFTRLDG